jgi:hypothetical protein
MSYVSDTAKVVSVLATFLLGAVAIAFGVPAVPTVVALVCGALLLNGFERAASKRDLWPD